MNKNVIVIIKGEIKMKKFFEKFIKNIEKANKQNFGDKKMDCCDLNQSSNKPRKNTPKA